MTRARRAMTTVEILMALAMGTIVLACLFALWQLSEKMHRASQSTVALQAALSMTEALFTDLRQIGLEPNASAYAIGPAGRPANTPGTSLSFYKVAFKPDRVVLVPVRYHLIPSPGGNKFLVRDELRAGKLDTKPFRACPVLSVDFDAHVDFWGGEYLRAAVVVLEEDRPPGTGYAPDRMVRQQVLMRLAVPDRLGDSAFSKVNTVIKEADLLPP